MNRLLPAVVVALTVLPVAVWSQGNPVGPEFRVNTYTTNQQSNPVVAADSAGNFVVVWRSLAQDNGVGNGVFGQRYDGSGAPVGPEFRVNTYVFASQSLPAVAVDGSGNFVVVWMSYTQDGSNWGVFGQRYASSGAALGPEFRANTYTTGAQAAPWVASDPSGNFVVVWQGDGQDGSSYGVFGQRYASSGAPLGPEFRLNTYSTASQSLPRVASDSSGNFVVVWRSDTQDGSVGGISGQRYASSGAPLGPEFRANTFTTGDQFRPDVSSDSSGNFVVVWVSPQDGGGTGVFGQRYDSTGAPVGPEFRVNSYTTSNQGYPQGYPSVAVDPSGDFVVVWGSSGQDGSGTGVFGQRFAGSGTPSGPEFLATTYTTNDQFRPFAAADPAGRFVVVWASDGQDGSTYGVFGQRYAPIVPVELMHLSIEQDGRPPPQH